MTAYLVDSSVWINHLRGVSDELTNRLSSMRSTEKLVTAEPIAMELLAGVPRAGVVSVERLLDSMPSLAIDSHADFRAAARIYRDVRAVGHTIRSMVGCLVAAVALRQGDVVVIHDDADFDRIAAVTGLRVERWPS